MKKRKLKTRERNSVFIVQYYYSSIIIIIILLTEWNLITLKFRCTRNRPETFGWIECIDDVDTCPKQEQFVAKKKNRREHLAHRSQICMVICDFVFAKLLANIFNNIQCDDCICTIRIKIFQFMLCAHNTHNTHTRKNNKMLVLLLFLYLRLEQKFVNYR